MLPIMPNLFQIWEHGVAAALGTLPQRRMASACAGALRSTL